MIVFYAIPLTTAPSPSSSSTTCQKRDNINPINGAVQDVQTTNFLKYAELRLTDKDFILIFYRDIYSQGKQYNMCVTDPKDIIDVPNAIIPTNLSQDVTTLTGNTLYQKFRKTGTVDPNYYTALSLLYTTNCGFESFLLMLRQAHTNLLIKLHTSADVSNFMEFKNIYK